MMRRQGPGPGRVNSRYASRLWIVAWALLAGLLIMAGVLLATGRLTGSDTVGAQGSTVPIAPPSAPPDLGGPALSVDLTAILIRLSIVLRTEEGARVPLTGARIVVVEDASGAQRAIFPFGLMPGQRLAAFHDPKFGFRWSPDAVGGTMGFPVSDGRLEAVLSIQFGPLQGDGRVAVAFVLGAELRVGSAEFSRPGSQTGRVRVRVEYSQLPLRLALDFESVASDAAVKSRIARAAMAIR